MSGKIVSASGERAAIGGYLPQFDEFAWLVYLNLINNKLEWIRVADPKAEKLDDIQYSDHSELHAYQVKWTIADANISFADFIELIPLITSSWKSLKANNQSKKVIPHLITNKPVSNGIPLLLSSKRQQILMIPNLISLFVFLIFNIVMKEKGLVLKKQIIQERTKTSYTFPDFYGNKQEVKKGMLSFQEEKLYKVLAGRKDLKLFSTTS